MSKVCITITWGEVDPDCDERKYSYQYHDNIVPAKDSEFSIWTSRTGGGSYRPGKTTDLEGDIRELVTGTVAETKYLYQESGRDSRSWRETLYVTVVLKDWTMGNAWKEE